MVHIIKALIYLPTLLTLLAILGAILWYKRKKRGKPIFIAAIIILWFFSTPFGAYIIVQPLIYKLEKIEMKQIPTGTNILVLGGGCQQGGNATADHLSNPTLRRLLEGYRIWKQLPSSNLVLSGTDWYSECNIASLSSNLIYEWNRDTTGVIQLNPALNTNEEANLYYKRFGSNKPIVLVSSAMHLPRAMREFNKLGIKVFPAPTDFPIQDYQFHIFDIFPSPKYLEASSSGWMEWMARIAGK